MYTTMFISTFLSVLWGKTILLIPPVTSPTTSVQAPTAVEPPSQEEEEYIIIDSYMSEVTAYASTVEETDETPFLAASGKHVYWGMVASNAHPFGTQLRFPELYPDIIFVVGDRMNKRYSSRFDIWFPKTDQTKQFGLKNTRVEIIREKKYEDIALK